MESTRRSKSETTGNSNPGLKDKVMATDHVANGLSNPASSEPSSEPVEVERLTRRQFWICLGLIVVMFMFITGPVWAHPWNINVLDWAIYLSYIPIPFLVVGLLAWRRKLNFRGAFLDILEMTLIKYAITFTFALSLWAVAKEPLTLRAFPLLPATAAAPEPLPPPSVIPPETTASLEGAAVDEAGKPLAGALVFVEAGLEAYVFAPPAEAVRLENTGAGITPRLAAAQIGQPIFARSTDGHLHTFVASSSGATLLNMPLISAGSFTPVNLRAAANTVVTLACSVHPQPGVEAPAHIGVFAHPFFAITGDDGRFRFEGVPAGSIRVGGFHTQRGRVSQEARLEKGESLTISVAFPVPR
jgi:hypothetical protein